MEPAPFRFSTAGLAALIRKIMLAGAEITRDESLKKSGGLAFGHRLPKGTGNYIELVAKPGLMSSAWIGPSWMANARFV